jgi:hypothetical protein
LTAAYRERGARCKLEKETMMPAGESEYKGNPMLVLTQGQEDRFPFQFGLKKAKLILEHLEDIKAFVAKHSKAPAE